MSITPILVMWALGGQALGPQGLEVLELQPQGTGNQVGLKKGDLLLSLDGYSLHTPFDLQMGEANIRKGEQVELVWLSGKERKTAKVGPNPLLVELIPQMAPQVRAYWLKSHELAGEKRFGEAVEQLESARRVESNPVTRAWLQYETALQRASGWDTFKASDDFIASAKAFESLNEWRSLIHTKRKALVFLAPIAFSSQGSGNKVFELTKDEVSLKGADLPGSVALERIRTQVNKGRAPLAADLAEAAEYPGLAKELEILLLAHDMVKAKGLSGIPPTPAETTKKQIEALLDRFPVQNESSPDLIPFFTTLIGLGENQRPDPQKVAEWFLRCFAKAEHDVCILALDFATGFAAMSMGRPGVALQIKLETLKAIRQVAEERFPNTGVHASALYFESTVELSINPMVPTDGFRRSVEILENLDERVGYGLGRHYILASAYMISVLRDLATNPNRAVDMFFKRPKGMDLHDLRLEIMSEVFEAVVLQVTGRKADAQVAYRKAMKLYEAKGKGDELLQRATLVAGMLMGSRPPDDIPLDVIGPKLSKAFVLVQSGKGPEPTTEADLRAVYDTFPATTLDREMFGTALATFALRRGSPTEALPLALEAHENFLRRRSELTMPEDRKRITEFAGGLAPVILTQTYLELGKSKEALEVLESVRARSLAEAMLLDGTGFKDSQQMKDFQSAQRRRRELADRYETVAPNERDVARKELDEAIREEETLFKALRNMDEKVRDFGYPENLTGDAICQAIAPNEVMATAVVADDRVWAIYADQNRIWSVKAPLLAKEVDRLINQYSSACVSSYLAPLPAEIAAGKRLYEALLGPIHDRIAKGTRLLIVPDPRFDRVPFAALPARGKYLIEWTPLRFEPSLTVMEVNRKRNQARSPGLRWVFAGDPAYHESGVTNQEIGADSPMVLPRLPDTKAEILAISKSVPAERKSVLLGAAASPSHILAALPTAGVVHLSCHGFNDRDRPLLSNLVFSPEFGNPSGTIRALDLFGHSIPAELVVLGACEIGGGQASEAEGTDSVARTLMHVGGKSVVGAIQKVPGEITADFLVEFYKGVRSGSRIDDSLRSAQIAMIRKPGSTPGHWAAFRLMGEGTALPPELLGKPKPVDARSLRVGSASRYVWAVAGVALILGIGMGRRWVFGRG